MKTICPAGRLPLALTLRMPGMFMRVVCGFSVTMAIFSPTRALSSVLLPALGRPKIETKPETKAERCVIGLLSLRLPGRRPGLFRLRAADPDLLYFARSGFQDFKTQAFVFHNLAGLGNAAGNRADQAADGGGVMPFN